MHWNRKPTHPLLILIAAACLWLGGVPTVAAQDNGDALTEDDQQLRGEALDRVLSAPDGAKDDWSNIDSGRHGSFTVKERQIQADGSVCRDLVEDRATGDAQASGAVTACHAVKEAGWHILRAEMGLFSVVPADLDGGKAGAQESPPIQVWVNPYSRDDPRANASETAAPAGSANGQ